MFEWNLQCALFRRICQINRLLTLLFKEFCHLNRFLSLLVINFWQKHRFSTVLSYQRTAILTVSLSTRQWYETDHCKKNRFCSCEQNKIFAQKRKTYEKLDRETTWTTEIKVCKFVLILVLWKDSQCIKNTCEMSTFFVVVIVWGP